MIGINKIKRIVSGLNTYRNDLDLMNSPHRRADNEIPINNWWSINLDIQHTNIMRYASRQHKYMPDGMVVGKSKPRVENDPA